MQRRIQIGLFALAACLLSGRAIETHAAQKAKTNATPQAVVDDLKAKSKAKQLKCTTSGGVHTCTSQYAWVCPTGWSACPLSPGVKTCCTK